ncbi:MAG TPA: Rv3654c family TadE-like protein [Galbitalea sp.]|jgi:secretion/DNA translocation related TadE-like protein|nr:Rv3654c family TadE-like protein [Galbitalea sp.]
MTRRSEWRGDRGSGSLLGLAIVGSLVVVVTLLVPLIVGLGIREALSDAADAAALAGADVAAGIAPGIPCEAAARLAAANGVSLEACAVDGLVVTVRTNRQFLGLELDSTATAGPPGG